VGARIWELIDTRQDVDAVCAQLQTEYAVAPDVCRAGVDAFLNELVERCGPTRSETVRAIISRVE
jgi:hypothetical protein